MANRAGPLRAIASSPTSPDRKKNVPITNNAVGPRMARRTSSDNGAKATSWTSEYCQPPILV
jgi:hypothetical protein